MYDYPNFSRSEYWRALNRIELTQKQRHILVAALGGTVFASDLASELETSVGGINLSEKALAIRLARQLDWTPLKRSETSLRWWPLLFSGSEHDDGRFGWTLHPNLRAALLDLNLNEEPMPSATRPLEAREVRVGQAKFRRDLIDYWDGKCAVTSVCLEELLEACHIKPWKDSSKRERLSTFNGLLLTANLHRLLDGGIISFRDSGELLVADGFRGEIGNIVAMGSRLRKLEPRHRVYLAYHRDNCFRDSLE